MAAERRRRRAGLAPRGMRYFLATGFEAFRRNGLMSLAAVTITMVTLLALGALLVVVGTLDHIARSLEQRFEVVVYLRNGLRATDVQTLEDRLRHLPGVAALTYVSKEDALVRLEQMFGGRLEIQDIVARNPLPDSFVMTADRPSRLPVLAAAVREFPQVEETSYGAQDVGRLLALTRLVRLSGVVAAAGLALVALIIITSTIRLTVLARRAEIEVMRLVGATAWFIRWPFVVEGAITGACGAGTAFLIVAGAYAVLAYGARSTFALLPLLSPGEVALAIFWKLSVWGILIGVLGSVLAVRKYLRI